MNRAWIEGKTEFEQKKYETIILTEHERWCRLEKNRKQKMFPLYLLMVKFGLKINM